MTNEYLLKLYKLSNESATMLMKRMLKHYEQCDGFEICTTLDSIIKSNSINKYLCINKFWIDDICNIWVDELYDKQYQ